MRSKAHVYKPGTWHLAGMGWPLGRDFDTLYLSKSLNYYNLYLKYSHDQDAVVTLEKTNVVSNPRKFQIINIPSPSILLSKYLNFQKSIYFFENFKNYKLISNHSGISR